MKSVLALVAVGLACAPPPAFELASIKPSDPFQQVAIRRSGHRIATTNTSLLFLISWAYDMHIAGSAQDERPSAPRRTPSQPTELQQMMQSLLAARFQFSIHRETRELPIDALVVNKSGPNSAWPKLPADFCPAVGSPCGSSSPESGTQDRSPEVSSTAFRAQPSDLRFASLIDIDFAVRLPARLTLPPHICCFFIGSRVCSTLPSDPPSPERPCASLTLHLHQVG